MTEAYAAVPTELKSKDNWVLWKLGDVDGRKTKLPYQLNGRKASSTDATTWKPFDAVKHSEPKPEHGIGFVFDGTGVIGIDLDKALLPDGTIEPMFAGLVIALTSYTEVSPSGNGLHIFVKCNELPYEKGRRKNFDNGKGIEIYSKERYFTVTGVRWNNSPDEIRDYPVETIRELLNPLLDGTKPVVANGNFVVTPTTPTSPSPVLTDEQIVYKASHAYNGDKFNNLMSGNSSGYPSDSEPDGALAMIFAFYTQDAHQIARIMHTSGLSRKKWDTNAGYLPRTIESAIAKYSVKFAEAWKPQHHTDTQSQTMPVTPQLTIITEAEIQAHRDEHIKSFKELPELPGFYKDYMHHGTKMSYAYPAFHFGTSLALISMVVERRVTMRSTAATIYPNVFVACIGATTISGKSTANDYGVDKFFFPLIRRDGKVVELSKKTTPQALIENLSIVPTRLWHYDECSEFFSDIKNQWAESLETNLCSAYDGRRLSYSLAKAKGKTDLYVADNVFLSCLWNTTNSEMERKADWSHVGNGFLPRWMFFWCHCENTVRESREETSEDVMEREALYDKIRKLQLVMKTVSERAVGVDTPIMFRPHPQIERWKLTDAKSHLKKEDELHRICSGRLVPQCYKIAMLLSMMDGSIQSHIDDAFSFFPVVLDIPDQYAELAIQICDDYLRPQLEYLLELCKFNDTKNYQIQVIRCLENHSGIAKRSLIQRETHLNKRVFDETLLSLEESEAIEIYASDITGGRKGHVVKLLK